MNLQLVRHYDCRKDRTTEDYEGIANSAALLQISEFRFFEIAYASWYGGMIPEREMECIFCSYLFEGLVPHWARQIARKVLTLHRQGKLDPRLFNIERRELSPEQRARGEWYVIVLLFTVTVFCVLLSG